MPSGTRPVVHETSFGNFTGRNRGSVIEYRGIKYANVKNQLSPPEVIERYTDVVDAMHYGPRAPAYDATKFEQESLIQQVIDDTPSPRMSGTQCLNLNITVPAEGVVTDLPVMVFIHGGGFLMGANSLPYWQPKKFVELSQERKMPVIVVNINYRLGVLGNLTSKELRDAGFPGNNSLRDQMCAFEWITIHIREFGGDPTNVTAFGVSAGSVSVLLHHLSPYTTFNRAIAMSGTPLMLKPRTESEAQTSYETLMSIFGLDDKSVEERIEYLISVSPRELVEKTPMDLHLTPFEDGKLIREAITFEDLATEEYDPNKKRPIELMIGDCQRDGNVYLLMGLGKRFEGLAPALYDSFTRTLDAESATLILQSYQIDRSTSDGDAMEAAINLATDIAYFAPVIAFARSLRFSRAYVYHFNETNPWDGQFKGISSHYLDAAFLFQNFKGQIWKYSQKAAMRAKEMACDFISFAHGRQPWAAYDETGHLCKVYGVDPLNTGRRETLFELDKKGVSLDNLMGAWDEFLAGN